MVEGEHGALRADARRNRERLLRAAAEIFAEQGLHAQTQDIARRAGVGVGTLFRHFPTKGELIETLSDAQTQVALGRVEAALADEDPGRGFEWLVAHLVAQHGQYRALGHALAAGGTEHTPVRAEFVARLDRLVRRAQRAGHLRADVDVRDVLLVLAACARTAEISAAGGHRRLAALALDGMRATGRSTLPAQTTGEAAEARSGRGRPRQVAGSRAAGAAGSAGHLAGPLGSGAHGGARLRPETSPHNR